MLSSQDSVLWQNLTLLHRNLQMKWLATQRVELLEKENNLTNSASPNDSVSKISCSPSRVELLQRIEGVVNGVIESLSNGTTPVLTYADYSSWNTVSYEEGGVLVPSQERKMVQVRYDYEKSLKKFELIVKVLSIIYKLIQENKFCTKRDLYYQDPDTFGKQATLDRIVDNIAGILNVPRWELNVLATTKGCVSGDLQFYDDHDQHIDCRGSKCGVSIPSHTKDMQNLHTQARFILIVEKDATFQKLLGENFCEKYSPCILLTAKGYPDLGTRLLLRLLWEQFQLPMFSLVDCDPHGFDITCVYTFGSRAHACENPRLAVPSIKWLGILPSDILQFNIPETSLIPLTENDIDKNTDLLRRPYVQCNWKLKEELQIMLQKGKKAEIQCLDSISSKFLCDVYIPNKLATSNWI